MSKIIGLLLAAGHSRRFGIQDKLMHPLSNQDSIAITSGKHLIAALANSVAVVKPDNLVLAAQLDALGYGLAFSASTDAGMADNLVTAIRHAMQLHPQAQGIVIALADMPFIKPATIQKVGDALNAKTRIVVPTYQGQRGHPVGFASQFIEALTSLSGDAGARSVVQQHPDEVYLLPVEDAGVVLDIDTPEDLARYRRV